jgi:protein involved in polysaccharide export with SLBB domain
MDNVTHTLISVMVGEAVHRSIPPSAVLSDRARRTVAITVLAVGGNLPDADIIYTQWAGTTLDYLLHHRGHTHTVVGALGLSLVLFLAVRLWWRYRKVTPRRADLWFLAGVSVLAPLLHIALDFTNSYGVHPFWPLDNHWYYGDAVFIVEPLLWACAAVLLFVLPSRTMRILIALVLAAGLGLSWFSGFVPASFAALLTLLTAPFALAQSSGYLIQPGDQLSITVLEDETLNRELLVLPDGRISVPLAGSIEAAGRTVEQVEGTIADRLAANFAVRPSVFVSVAAVTETGLTFPIYVVGQVTDPGVREIEPGTTLLQAISLAGGLERFAATKRIQLRRADPSTGQERLYIFNYNAVERGGAIQSMITLREGDVIVVPERRLFE